MGRLSSLNKILAATAITAAAGFGYHIMTRDTENRYPVFDESGFYNGRARWTVDVDGDGDADVLSGGSGNVYYFTEESRDHIRGDPNLNFGPYSKIMPLKIQDLATKAKSTESEYFGRFFDEYAPNFLNGDEIPNPEDLKPMSWNLRVLREKNALANSGLMFEMIEDRLLDIKSLENSR